MKTKRNVLLTAGLPYSNGRLHVGHIAGCYLPADIIARYLRMRGHNVRYVCGSDDHGVAIMMTAAREGKTPAEVANYYNQKQQEDFKGLDIQFDVYGSTSQNKFHQKLCQDFFLRIHEKGYFEKRKTKQFYDMEKQVFLPDRFVKGKCAFCGALDQNGDQCEECGKLLDADSLLEAYSTLSKGKVALRETVHWFLDLSKFEENVTSWLEQAKLRDCTKTYVKSLIKSGLVTRSMTRDINWGIPLPLKDDHDAQDKVLYVWFDAPIGYISNTMQMCEKEGESDGDYQNWWSNPQSEILHFVGEDNTIFHCLIWIAMLSAQGSINLPKGVIVNQFVNIKFEDQEIEKMSKSRGTAVWIGDYLKGDLHPDILRYYLTSIAPEKGRAVYRPDELTSKNNTDLANVLGNFINRVLSFTQKYIGPHVPTCHPDKISKIDLDFENSLKEAHKQTQLNYENYSTKGALQVIIDFARECNKYIDDKAPWATRKTDLPKTEVTLYYGIWALKFFAITLHPIMPNKTFKLASFLNIDLSKIKWEDALLPLNPLAPLNKEEILFQKIL